MVAHGGRTADQPELGLAGGIIHALGVELATEQARGEVYHNPHPIKILVEMSAMPGAQGVQQCSLTALGQFVEPGLGSLFTADQPQSWVSVSLKGGRRAIGTHYRLGYHESGNDAFAPRHWALQGSNGAPPPPRAAVWRRIEI
eukprot:SAG11_NODE_2460_length_3337_cov_3.537544_1_plen_143_part_00